MDLTPYEKIPERLALDEAAHRAFARVPFVVTEKVHGASFVLVTDGTVVRAAKRKAFLSEEELFFGHRAVVDRLEEAVRRAFRSVPGAVQLAVHGELFGGTPPVQTGVWYSPRVELAAFDVAVTDRAGRRYLDDDDVRRLLDAVGMPVLPALFTGRLEEALAFPLGFDSHVPRWLGLEPPAGSNPAEGVVVKASRTVNGLRPVVKRKIPGFAEDPRFHEAAPPAARPGTEALAAWFEERVGQLVNEARLHAAVSKLGPPRDESAWAALADELARDAWESLVEAHPREVAALDAHGVERVQRRGRLWAAELVAILRICSGPTAGG